MIAKIRIALIGACMGAAEVVPGVSGGTIAFIGGIYERLINAIRQLTPMLLADLRRNGLVATWQQVDGIFLLLLFGGMGLSIVLFASLIGHLMTYEPVALWSFFLGLVVASVWVISRRIERFRLELLAPLVLASLAGAYLTSFAQVDLPDTLPYVFLGGAIAVCAWILPGLSGSFILLILGLYSYVIDAIRHLDLVVMAVLATGCALGLMAFSQFLSWLFNRFRDETLMVLTGFMLGSLGKLWPWKVTVTYRIRSDGSQMPLIQESVLPAEYELATGLDSQLLLAMTLVASGVALVVLLQRFGGQSDGATKSST